MTQSCLFPLKPSATNETIRPFGSYRDATEYARTLPGDTWLVKILHQEESTVWYVKAVMI